MSFDNYNYATAACNYPWISIGTLNGDALARARTPRFRNVKKLYNREIREYNETRQSRVSAQWRERKRTRFNRGRPPRFSPFPHYRAFFLVWSISTLSFDQVTLPFRLLISPGWTFWSGNTGNIGETTGNGLRGRTRYREKFVLASFSFEVVNCSSLQI